MRRAEPWARGPCSQEALVRGEVLVPSGRGTHACAPARVRLRVCMNVHVHVCAHACLCAHTCLCVHVWWVHYTCARTFMHACVCTRVFMCVRVWVYTCLCVCLV